MKKLSELLGVPVVETIARSKKTLEKLKNTVYDVCDGKIKCNPKAITYMQDIEDGIIQIENKLK